uniref:Probable beta-arrestin (inferred by orthology to a C. elegans protein) n=1 Tax=Anisakis simplex TaxID=6269 RepID=A0A0M3KEU6_ANISI
LKTVVGSLDTNGGDKPKKHNCVRLAIRKLTYAPYENRPQPTIEVTKEFMMSPGLLHMEASLDKEASVNVHVQNNSNKTVKRIKVAVVQIADICLFTTASYTCEVAKVDSTNRVKRFDSVSSPKHWKTIEIIVSLCFFTLNTFSEGFPVGPGATLSKVYTLCPLLSNNKDKRGLALDGQLKHEDTNLASSTTLEESQRQNSKMNQATTGVEVDLIQLDA